MRLAAELNLNKIWRYDNNNNNVRFLSGLCKGTTAGTITSASHRMTSG